MLRFRSFNELGLKLLPAVEWVLLLTVMAAPSMQAGLIHDNGPPDRKNGSEMTHWIEADDFTFDVAARLESVKFWNVESGAGFQGSILWEIYSNSDSNTPGTLLFTGTSMNLAHVATGQSISGYAEYVNTFDITPVSIPAGKYWLALHNGPLTTNADKRVYWEATNKAGTTPSYADLVPFDGDWFSNAFPGLPSELAFQLNGVLGPRVTAFALKPGPRISFTTTAGQNYRVEYKNNLTDASWTPVSGAASVSGTGSVVQISDPDPNVGNLPRRFYRARLL